MAFAQEPSELEKELVGRDFQGEFTATCDKFNWDLTGILTATEVTRERNSMFTKRRVAELIEDEYSIVVLGNMAGGPQWSTQDMFEKNGNPLVHTLGFYVHGGKIDSSGTHVLQFLMSVLKPITATAAAPTAAQKAAAAFHHPETIQTTLGDQVLVVKPGILFAKTGDQTVRTRYTAAVDGLKNYAAAATSPNLKRARMEEALESRTAGTSGQGLFGVEGPLRAGRSNQAHILVSSCVASPIWALRYNQAACLALIFGIFLK